MQREILPKEGKLVDNFWVGLFLVCSIRDDSFHLYLSLGDVDSSVAILCLRGYLVKEMRVDFLPFPEKEWSNNCLVVVLHKEACYSDPFAHYKNNCKVLEILV